MQGFPTRVVSLQAEDDILHVGDAARGVSIVRYAGRPTTATDVPLVLVADDMLPRHLSCMCMVDRNCVIGGDKFGNVFVLKFPTAVRVLWLAAVVCVRA